MKCLFCNQKMWQEEDGPDSLFFEYKCFSIKCMVNNDFPRYICGTDKTGEGFCWQEYATEGFYVKVSSEGSTIYRLISCMLNQGVKVPESLWIDQTNLSETLDKVRGLHYILWNG